MKKIVIWIVMQFLYRGMKVLYHDDERIKEELDGWNEDKVICLTVLHGPSITFEYSYLDGLKKSKKKPDLLITFKSIDSALIVFTGMMSVKQAFLEHRFSLKGDVYESMRFVRCVDLVETYLFPRFMTKRILNHREVKYKSSLIIYIKAILTI
ncbi:MAG: hypothetical protein RR585_12885 [Coprobacillus sp.]